MANSWFIYNGGDPASHLSYSKINRVPVPFPECDEGCCESLYAIYASVFNYPPIGPIVTTAIYVAANETFNGQDTPGVAIGGPPFVPDC